jgi:predicted transcriptional regulator of viral defense system
MKGIELFKVARELNKSFFTIADLEKITGLPRRSLYVTLKRWVDDGLMERVGQGIYLPAMTEVSLETVAAQLYIPNYLSFESALARYGILNLVPYTLTFATPRKTRKFTLRKHGVEFRQIAPKLFFGYEMKNGINIATPEKAFLDQLYFHSRGKASMDFDELNLKGLSRQIARKFGERYPGYVQKRLGEILVA